MEPKTFYSATEVDQIIAKLKANHASSIAIARAAGYNEGMASTLAYQQGLKEGFNAAYKELERSTDAEIPKPIQANPKQAVRPRPRYTLARKPK